MNLNSWFKSLSRAQLLMFLVLGLALLVSLIIGFSRVVVEFQNKDVELVLDYDDLLSLNTYTGVVVQDLFPMLAQAGVTTIALEEDSMPNLEKQGRATWMIGQEIINTSRIAQVQNYILQKVSYERHIRPGYNYIVIDEEETYQRALNALIDELGEDRVHELGGNVIEAQTSREEVARVGFGISPRILEYLKANGFQVIPRLVNSTRLNEVSLTNKVRSIERLKGIYTIIFSGSTVLGGNNNIQPVAEGFKNFDINFGFVEFGNQIGAFQLAENLPERMLLVHSASSSEMSRLSPARLIQRYVLAVSERGIRILYLRPILDMDKYRDLITANQTYITRIRETLESEGFHIRAIKKPMVSNIRTLSFVEILILGLGTWMSLCLLLELFFVLNLRLLYGGIVAVAILALLSLLTGHLLAFRKLCVLAIVVIYPTLAMIRSIPYLERAVTHTALKERFKAMLKALLPLLGISAVGIVLVTGILSDPYYMQKIYQFAGVKIAFVLPIVLVAAYYFFYPKRLLLWRYLVQRFLSTRVTLGAVMAVGLGVAFLGIYIARSDNFILPLPDVEARLRLLLSQLLGVRPRTKEFLLGYPILILCGVYLNTLLSRKWLWLGLAVATIAPVSLMNTFCHIHTPFVISLIRSINGVVGGILMAAVYVFLIEAFRKLWKLWVE